MSAHKPAPGHILTTHKLAYVYPTRHGSPTTTALRTLCRHAATRWPGKVSVAFGTTSGFCVSCDSRDRDDVRGALVTEGFLITNGKGLGTRDAAHRWFFFVDLPDTGGLGGSHPDALKPVAADGVGGRGE